MAKCDMCGKGPEFGHHVSHSKRATRRQFKPNLQKHTLYVNGQRRQMNVCTTCLKTLTKAK
jgi:large subunit ribosomal protein L28